MIIVQIRIFGNIALKSAQPKKSFDNMFVDGKPQAWNFEIHYLII
jgi:hypothetical protein